MTDEQTRDFNRGNAGLIVLDDNNVIWNGNAAVSDKVLKFRNSLTKILRLKTIQETDAKGNTQTKLLNKLKMGEKGIVIASVLAQFAEDTGNLTLKEEVNFSLSDLTPKTDTTAKTRNQLVHDRADSNLVALTAGGYGITALMISDYQTAIDTFMTSVPKRKEAGAITKAATAALKTEMKKMIGLMDGIGKLLIVFKSANLDFYNEYFNAIKSVDIGGKILTIDVRYFDLVTGVPLPKVKSTLVETGEVKTSSKIGRVPYYSEPSGNYTLDSLLKGYKADHRTNIPVKQGEITRLEIKLEKE